MKRDELTRRDFHRLTAAAMGGLVAGTIAGCGGGDQKEAGTDGARGTPGTGQPAGPPSDATAVGDAEKYDVALLLEEPHVCRGLNTCMNKGASGENACAGQG
ncbi:MAG TPA: hypothetical protein VML55_22985, partial [Planctomycetaceae bacterium]|nr:hypothetical protein [Planctomycetaceae bacterium]